MHKTKSSILDIHVSGRAVAQAYYVGVMEREVAWFVSVGILLLVAFLWFAFRTVWGILVPVLTVVLMSGLWTLGIMVATGKAVDVMTVVLPTILFVVGISDVVHVLTRYYDERRSDAARGCHATVVPRSGLATFLTSLTTALGS